MLSFPSQVYLAIELDAGLWEGGSTKRVYKETQGVFARVCLCVCVFRSVCCSFLHHQQWSDENSGCVYGCLGGCLGNQRPAVSELGDAVDERASGSQLICV